MEGIAGKPENDGAPPDTAQRGHDKAHYFPSGCLLPGSKGPILIQEKTVHRTQAESQRAISKKRECAGGRKEPQQAIQNQQVHEGIQSTDQAKPQQLPEQVKAVAESMRTGILFIIERWGRRRNFRCFYSICFK